MYNYLKYHLEYDCENKLVSTITFQKVMANSKTLMERKYELESKIRVHPSE